MPSIQDIATLCVLLTILFVAAVAVGIASDAQIACHSIYEFLRDQGSLLSGMLAVAAGLLAYGAGASQAAAARAQNDANEKASRGRERATRSLLSNALVELSDYSREMAKQTLMFYPPVAGSAVKYQRGGDAPVLQAPQSAIVRLSEAIAVTKDDDSVENLATIIERCQVQDSRYKAVRSYEHLLTEPEIENNISLSLEVIARCNAVFKYARLESEIVETYSVGNFNTEVFFFLNSSQHARSLEIMEKISDNVD